MSSEESKWEVVAAVCGKRPLSTGDVKLIRDGKKPKHAIEKREPQNAVEVGVPNVAFGGTTNATQLDGAGYPPAVSNTPVAATNHKAPSTDVNGRPSRSLGNAASYPQVSEPQDSYPRYYFGARSLTLRASPAATAATKPSPHVKWNPSLEAGRARRPRLSAY